MSSWILKLLKDRITFTIGFFLNSTFLILFFYLSNGYKEYVYPVILSVFIFVIIIIIEAIKYIPFNRHLEQSIINVNYELEPSTEEQQHVTKTIHEIHKNYLTKLYTLNTQINEKEHFFSHWIHNIKTPVSVIDLIVQKAEIEQIDLLQGMQQIKQENIRIHRILEQILNVIRLEDFSKDYTPEAVNLVEILKRIINNKKNQFIYNHIYPKLETPSDRLLVLSDAKWNVLMIEQIISNAIKYSKVNTDKSNDQSKYIYINITQKDNQTILTIRDEGIGIPSYDIRKVFEPFFTGENGRKYQDATGIGLYMCSKIAEKLGHHISIDSEVNKGTIVTITYLSKNPPN